MSSLNLNFQLLAFDDVPASSNPRLRRADWQRILREVKVDRPETKAYLLSPGEELVLFDGSRTLSVDGTTELTISQSSLATDRYRLAWTGNGGNPQFKLSRNIAFSGVTLAVTLNSNGSVTITTVGGGSPNYALAQPGDTALIPGPATGDAAGPFASNNVGYWVVLAASASSITLARPAGESATGETQASVAVTNDTQLQVFAPDRVKVGDFIVLSAGFASSARKSFKVLSVSPKYIDFQSSTPLAAETAVPTAAGIKAYSAARRVVYLETTQDCVVRVNGDTSDNNPVEPIEGADTAVRIGWFSKCGPTWKLAVVNKSTSDLELVLLTAV